MDIIFNLDLLQIILIILFYFLFSVKFVKHIYTKKLMLGAGIFALFLLIMSIVFLLLKLNILLRLCQITIGILYFLIFLNYRFQIFAGLATLTDKVFTFKQLKKTRIVKHAHKTKEIMNALVVLQKCQIGALIVFQPSNVTYIYPNKGIFLNAEISSELILSLFYPKSRLHDGAIIIQNGKISYAGVILPLSQTREKSSYGTRHLAGLGINEKMDFPAIIVSEETQCISIANNRKIQPIKDKKKLKEIMEKLL